MPLAPSRPTGMDRSSFARRSSRSWFRSAIVAIPPSAKKVRGNLKLDSRAAMLQGGDTGPAVVPGKAGESLIVQALRHRDGLEMPPKKPRLPASVIADFETWITMGAPTPADDDSGQDRRRARGGATALGVSAAEEADPSRRSRMPSA